MSHRHDFRRPLCLLTLLLVATPMASSPAAAAAADYAQLLTLFEDWRAFEAPAFVDGVPQYTPEAMTAKQTGLPELRARLDAMDVETWPLEQRIDWHLVRAEMNGLDFDLRVRRPWANNPAYYVMLFDAESDVPAHEGPVIHTWIDTWTYEYPLSGADAAELAGAEMMSRATRPLARSTSETRRPPATISTTTRRPAPNWRPETRSPHGTCSISRTAN